MTAFENVLANLGPKTAKAIKRGNQVSTVTYPTASLTLNQALGGGIGGNRMTLLHGNYSAGKTMLVLQTIGVLQKLGVVCAFVDVEGTFDPLHAERLGVNTDELLVVQVRLASQVEAAAVALIQAGVGFIAVDSISTMMVDVFIKDGEMKGYEDRGQIGADAKGIKRMIKGLLYAMTGTECSLVLISQTTTEIGQTYVKQIAEGGKAPGFYSTQIIKLTSSDNDKEQIKGEVRRGSVMVEQPIGRKVEAKVTKNKLNGSQSTSCKYDIYYGGPFLGIDNVKELIDLATEQEVITKSGSWFYYHKGQEDEVSWQGNPSMVKAIRADDELFAKIKAEYEEKINGNPEE